MDRFVVEGKQPLGGEIRVGGNKNAVLPMIAAALLTDEEVVLRNVPRLVDVTNMLEIASSLGVSVSFEKDVLRLRAAKLKTCEVPHELCSRVRTSILFAGPLVGRCGEAVLWPPGGDVIGRRRIDGHFYGLHSLGAELITSEPPFHFRVAQRLRGRDLFLDEASVTATENIMMAAVLAEGKTILRNAAAEPHVRQLAELLNLMGAKISGLDTNTLYIEGVERLGGADMVLDGDHIEAGSYLCLGAALGAELRIMGTVPRHYWMTRRIFERFGVRMELNPDHIFLPGGQRLVVEPDFGNAIPVISDGPWPQFPSDMMSCMIVTATQAKGTVLFFEKMFESRIYFVDRLISMGANAIVCDPHRAVISGPAELRGQELASPDIRAGMALLIAALCARGRSVINNAEIIARGYENLEAKLSFLGAKISS
ncbi:MAG: UDP-N-acetylglucosamine 1-carboxyvinyltransferase [Lentisphaerae bacterium GWF2_52_8]|nr:MAG: UDP-N-acetylglucosamine 1-carboxyvinyltransferase [Lentisphaerae bacterium GWF2_52_8]